MTDDEIKATLMKMQTLLSDATVSAYMLMRGESWRSPGEQRDELVASLDENLQGALRTLLALRLPGERMARNPSGCDACDDEERDDAILHERDVHTCKIGEAEKDGDENG